MTSPGRSELIAVIRDHRPGLHLPGADRVAQGIGQIVVGPGAGGKLPLLPLAVLDLDLGRVLGVSASFRRRDIGDGRGHRFGRDLARRAGEKGTGRPRGLRLRGGLDARLVDVRLRGRTAGGRCCGRRGAARRRQGDNARRGLGGP